MYFMGLVFPHFRMLNFATKWHSHSPAIISKCTWSQYSENPVTTALGVVCVSTINQSMLHAADIGFL